MLIAGALLVATSALRAHDPVTGAVTWTGDIARIVRARCTRCHAGEGPAPMSLATYAAARPWARAIREEVLTRRMPKWHAARGYGDFRNDPSLSPFEISLIVAWVDGGAPEGKNPPDARPEPAGAQPPPADVSQVETQQASEMTIPCGEQPLPRGRLVALRPRLEEGSSAGFAVARPDGRREVVAWIRNFERRFETTYWLRRPLDLPGGSRLLTEGASCSIVLTIISPR